MTYAGMPARLATVVAEQPNLVAMWDGSCGLGLHRAQLNVGPQLSPGEGAPPPFERSWDGSCERCGVSIPWDDGDSVRLVGGCDRIWDTLSGKLEPGCLYWANWLDNEHRCFYRWTNCDGRHLHAILPNGRPWDIDSSASNCTMPNDTEHRCWVRHGEPPNLHVDKAGHTCAAGAGSILAGDYHGFLHNGAFTAG